MATSLNFDIANIDKDTSTTTYASKKNDSLGKDEFLQLLVTQLKYQDPLKPMDDKEFIGQMAQFSSLEQMQNLNNSFVTNKAMSLMGKYVEGTIEEDGEATEIAGYVESIRVAGSSAYAVVNGKDVPMESIYEIRDKDSTVTEEADYLNISQYKGLVGSKVNSMVGGINADTVFSFSGNVQSIKVIGNQPLAVIDGIEATIDSLVLSDEEKEKVTTVKEYLESNIGNKISAVISNTSGETTKVTGTLNSVSGDDSKPNVVFDGVNTSVDNIYEMF